MVDVLMNKRKELVVLLHGIGRTHLSMRPIEKALIKENYHTLNIHYPSRKLPIEDLATFVFNKIKDFPHYSDFEIHIVSHSMGGIVTRVLLDQYPLPNFKRIVMLAPPNQGSEVADFFRNSRLYQYFYGPSGQQLSTHYAKESPFPLIKHELGIIAGSLCIEPLSYFLLPKKNDGMVTIESTKLFEMTDHLILPVTHSFLMFNKKVIKQIIIFLEAGKFKL